MLAICIICTTTSLHILTDTHTYPYTHTPADNHDLHLSLAIPAGSCLGRAERRSRYKDTKNVGWTRNKDLSAPLLACDIFYECKSLFIRIWFTYLRATSSVFLAAPPSPSATPSSVSLSLSLSGKHPHTHPHTYCYCRLHMWGRSFSSDSVFYSFTSHFHSCDFTAKEMAPEARWFPQGYPAGGN